MEHTFKDSGQNMVTVQGTLKKTVNVYEVRHGEIFVQYTSKLKSTQAIELLKVFGIEAELIVHKKILTI